MKYIFNYFYIKNHEALFTISSVVIILIIILLIVIGIKVINKKWQLMKFHTILLDL